MGRNRPFFTRYGGRIEIRGTWLARDRPHVLPLPSEMGYGYWIAVYRGESSIDKSPSEAARKVVTKVKARRHGDAFVLRC